MKNDRLYTVHKASSYPAGTFREEPEDTFATYDLALLKAKRWAREDRESYQIKRGEDVRAVVSKDGDVYLAPTEKGKRQ